MACGEEAWALDGTSPVPWQTSQHRWIAGNLFGTSTGWWFGTWFLFFIILPYWEESSQLTIHYLSEGLKPPTSQFIEEEPGMSYAGC